MSVGDLQMIEDAANIRDCVSLGVGIRILRYIRRRIASSVERDRAIATTEKTDLRLPADRLAGELVNEDHRDAVAGLLVGQRHTVDLCTLAQGHPYEPKSPRRRLRSGTQLKRRQKPSANVTWRLPG